MNFQLRALYPLIEDVSKNLTEYIDKELRIVGDQGIEARELCGKFTTDVVSNSIFSLDAGSLKEKNAVVRGMAKELLKPSLRLFILFTIGEMCPSLNKILRMSFIPKEVEQFFTKLMTEAAQKRRTSKDDKADVLQYMLSLQEKKNLNDVELVANAITFFIDGYETSSISMSFILFELARNKRVQEKSRQEILAAEDEEPLTMDSIADLPYLDQIIYEAMRLNSTVGALAKKCISECEIELTEDGERSFSVPVGTPIIIPVYDIHRDPANYENPLEFNPERFDKERGGVRAYKDKGTLLVFGMGPRACLGQRFALTQMKAALVGVLKKFDISVNEKTQVPLTMDPKEFLNVAQGGIWLDFKRL